MRLHVRFRATLTAVLGSLATMSGSPVRAATPADAGPAVLPPAVGRAIERGTPVDPALVAAGPTALPGLPRTLRLDRPFLLAITDQETGAVLFLGQMEDPG